MRGRLGPAWVISSSGRMLSASSAIRARVGLPVLSGMRSGTCDLGDDLEVVLSGGDHLARGLAQQLLDALGAAQAAADVGEHAVDGDAGAGVVAALGLGVAQVVGVGADGVQGGLDLGRGHAGEGGGEQGVLLVDAEDVGGEAVAESGQAVQEDGLPGVLVEREALRMGVVLVHQGRVAVAGTELAAVGAAHVGGDDGQQLGALGAADQLVGEAMVAQVQMTGMDRRDRRMLSPEVGDGQREDAQHAAGPLEGLDRGELPGEVVDQGRVKGVVGDHALAEGLLARGLGQQGRGAPVHVHVGVGGAGCGVLVDAPEQAACEHARDLLAADRGHGGDVAGDDAADLAVGAAGDVQGLGLADLLALGLGDDLREHRGLAGEGVLLAGQGQDHGDAGVVLGVLEQGHQEGGDAGATAGAGRFDAGGVGRQLVEHDEDAPALEDQVEVFVSGGAEGGRGGADLAVEVLAADLEGDLAPEGVGDQARALGLVDRDPVAGDADDGGLACVQEQGGVDQLARGLGDLGAAVGEMGGPDQGVGLAAAEGGLQALDGGVAGVTALEAAEDVAQHLAHAFRGVGAFAEKGDGVRVDVLDHIGLAPVVADDLHQVGGEDLGVEGPGEQVLARRACVEDGHRHAAVSFGVRVLLSSFSATAGWCAWWRRHLGCFRRRLGDLDAFARAVVADHDLDHVGQAAVIPCRRRAQRGLDRGRDADRQGFGLGVEHRDRDGRLAARECTAR